MAEKFNIIVLASGNGTTLEAIIDAIESGALSNVNILAVISNVDYAGALRKAEDHGAPAFFISEEGKSRDEYSNKLLLKVKEIENDSGYEADLICLAGFMRILTKQFIREFPQKIVNVHPSLLPKFGGKGMYGEHVHEAVLEAGETKSGMTLHYVDEGVDTGEVIMQKEVPVSSEDTVATLKKKVQDSEKIGYVELLKKLSGS